MNSILITGSSTGIGRDTALKLSEKHRVFAAVRDVAVGEELRKKGGPNVVPVILDVTDAKGIRKAAEQVAELCGEEGLYGLVNNAGIVVPGPLEALPIDELRKQFEVNVIGMVAVTQAFLPQLRKAHGRIVNVGSIAGRLTAPFIGAYSASKFAVEAISDAFRRELDPQGIWVALIEPGAIQTPIWEKSAKKGSELQSGVNKDIQAIYASRLDKFQKTVLKTTVKNAIPAKMVVDAIEHALESRSPRTRYLVGTEAKLTALVALLPDKAIDLVIRKRI